MVRPVKTAVFPVAGLGTRFLPATRAMPKEMLTVVDRPVIQLAVDEAREAGIEHFVFVTGRGKAAIEDHFDKAFELDATLAARGRTGEIAALAKDLPKAGQASFTRQQEPLGLGHAVWCARQLVRDEPFALLLPDMVMRASPGCLRQMIDVYETRGGGNVVAVEEVPWEQVSRYGVVGAKDWTDNAFTITGMVEKPKTRELAPSNLIISGRYILQPEIFGEIESQEPGAGGEIQITDAMIRLMQRERFHGLKYRGTTYDCGDKVGFLAANVAFALDRPDVGPGFRDALRKILAEKGGL
ncbi:UTP--glucose-1-phosphate uridylyltransferase [Aestuariivirga sp.]|uniref:UTP--glucose-1-phosphate uridylyltransferase n=1 Tax=Aestuariivirga sp. TaxID=2650926 RepID=UPI0025C724A2|nr:UTP--glucose-1-phosphate uridylyltransferase [Aestuariivirga sp.]MCA3556547.1 UTP--glucose-1-phosphate uridylyltransferase [Aestuariivirga sp.]